MTDYETMKSILTRACTMAPREFPGNSGRLGLEVVPHHKDGTVFMIFTPAGALEKVGVWPRDDMESIGWGMNLNE